MKMQGEELLALADTSKVLTDDDALDLFKKTMPGSGTNKEVASATKTRQEEHEDCTATTASISA